MKISGKVNDDRLMDGGEKYGGVKRIKLDSEYLKISKEEKIWLKWMRWGKRMGCHQKAERSFFFRGYQFPVCARCTGVLTASIVACAIFSVYRLEWKWCICLGFIMLADWTVQKIGFAKSTNVRRLVTGLAGGYGCMTLQLYLYSAFVEWIIDRFVSIWR